MVQRPPLNQSQEGLTLKDMRDAAELMQHPDKMLEKGKGVLESTLGVALNRWTILPAAWTIAAMRTQGDVESLRSTTAFRNFQQAKGLEKFRALWDGAVEKKHGFGFIKAALNEGMLRPVMGLFERGSMWLSNKAIDAANHAIGPNGEVIPHVTQDDMNRLLVGSSLFVGFGNLKDVVYKGIEIFGGEGGKSLMNQADSALNGGITKAIDEIDNNPIAQVVLGIVHFGLGVGTIGAAYSEQLNRLPFIGEFMKNNVTPLFGFLRANNISMDELTRIQGQVIEQRNPQTQQITGVASHQNLVNYIKEIEKTDNVDTALGRVDIVVTRTVHQRPLPPAEEVRKGGAFLLPPEALQSPAYASHLNAAISASRKYANGIVGRLSDTEATHLTNFNSYVMAQALPVIQQMHRFSKEVLASNAHQPVSFGDETGLGVLSGLVHLEPSAARHVALNTLLQVESPQISSHIILVMASVIENNADVSPWKDTLSGITKDTFDLLPAAAQDALRRHVQAFAPPTPAPQTAPASTTAPSNQTTTAASPQGQTSSAPAAATRTTTPTVALVDAEESPRYTLRYVAQQAAQHDDLVAIRRMVIEPFAKGEDAEIKSEVKAFAQALLPLVRAPGTEDANTELLQALVGLHHVFELQARDRGVKGEDVHNLLNALLPHSPTLQSLVAVANTPEGQEPDTKTALIITPQTLQNLSVLAGQAKDMLAQPEPAKPTAEAPATHTALDATLEDDAAGMHRDPLEALRSEPEFGLTEAETPAPVHDVVLTQVATAGSQEIADAPDMGDPAEADGLAVFRNFINTLTLTENKAATNAAERGQGAA